MSDEISKDADGNQTENMKATKPSSGEDIYNSLDSSQTEDINHWLTIGSSVALFLVLFVTIVSMFLVFALRDDVVALRGGLAAPGQAPGSSVAAVRRRAC